MAVEKVYTCDLCGQQQPRDQLMRLGVRALDDRPEDAENIDVGSCCLAGPVSDVLKLAAERADV